jgi:hypothetical protein
MTDKIKEEVNQVINEYLQGISGKPIPNLPFVLYDENGQLHNDNGPAIEYWDGGGEWFRHGIRHRLDGPAILKMNGEISWYINGYFATDRLTKWADERNIDLENLTDEDKAIIIMEWSNFVR